MHPSNRSEIEALAATLGLQAHDVGSSPPKTAAAAKRLSGLLVVQADPKTKALLIDAGFRHRGFPDGDDCFWAE